MTLKMFNNYMMMSRSLYFLALSTLLIYSCLPEQPINSYALSSPSETNEITFKLDQNGAPFYQVFHQKKMILDSSYMGFELLDQNDLLANFSVIEFEALSVDEPWEMQWGEQRHVQNQYNQLSLTLQEKLPSERVVQILFRVYDDGIAFRYHFPEQATIDTLFILEEHSEFNLRDDHTCWWIPGDWDIYEHLYTTSRFSKIDAIPKSGHPNLAQTYIPVNAVNTPVTMRTNRGIHLSFHEANLTDYAGMTLKVDTTNLKMTSGLVGSDRTKYKVKRTLPFSTPWRSLQIANSAPELIESNLIVNLNDPNKIGDVSWFKPKKYMGIWWEMHIGKSTWDMGSGRHGATTENAKKYIDFASANGITGLLIEGWNTGWGHWIGFEDREGIFDFITPYEDYDIKEVVRYAKEKGVEIIMHHETSSAPRTFDQQLDTAMALAQSLGIHATKTGYVGSIIPKGEYHHGQWMVNHYRKVLETAATYQVAVNAHEPIKATGIRRTYPNCISREGLRGQEFNAWASDGGNPPEHLPIVAFTRMLSGPIDFTPGVFNLTLPEKPNNQINTTLAHQLALYVVLYSPIQMACDLPENYQGHPAFQFIREVGVNWEETRVLEGEVGDYVCIARKERETEDWFVGAITDEEARSMSIKFDFLDKDVGYEASVYKDGADADYKNNPASYSIETMSVNKDTELKIDMAKGGGFAITLKKL